METEDSTKKPSGRDVKYYAFLAILIVFSFQMAFFKISDYDIWWHLKTGELILSHGIPSGDPFSFTAFGNHWVTHEWLAEVLLYILYSLGGLTMLIIIKALVSSLIAFLIFEFGIGRGQKPAFSASIAIFTAAGMSYMMYPRPHIFTYLFLALLGMILFKDASGRKRYKLERWVILPAIFLLWANMHAGFLLGLAIYWAFALRELIFPFERGRMPGIRFKTSIFPVLFATLVCLVNPNGYEVFTYPINIAMTPAFKSSISEWVSPIYLGSTEWLAKSILILASIAGVIAAWIQLRKRPEISVVIIASCISAWLAMRNIQNYVIILAFGILSAPALPMIHFAYIPAKLKKAGATIAIAWILACFFLIRDYQAQEGRLGTGIQDGLVPIGAAEFLHRIDFEGNILNVLSDGGYLIWSGYPKWHVFVDGRLDVYGVDQIENYRRVIEGANGAMELLDNLNVGAAILPMPPSIGSIRDQMAVDKNWSLVYFDDYYLVFLRHNPKYDPAINKYGYSFINPLGPLAIDDSTKFMSIQAEAQRAAETSEQSHIANRIYADVLRQEGEFINAALHYKTALDVRPTSSDLYRSIARMYFSAGSGDSALSWYMMALELMPDDPWLYYDLGLYYIKSRNFDRAEFYFNEALARDSSSPARAMLDKIRALRTPAPSK